MAASRPYWKGYASVQLGEEIAVGVHPLLFNAEKAEALRKRQKTKPPPEADAAPGERMR